MRINNEKIMEAKEKVSKVYDKSCKWASENKKFLMMAGGAIIFNAIVKKIYYTGFEDGCYKTIEDFRYVGEEPENIAWTLVSKKRKIKKIYNRSIIQYNNEYGV